MSPEGIGLGLAGWIGEGRLVGVDLGAGLPRVFGSSATGSACFDCVLSLVIVVSIVVAAIVVLIEGREVWLFVPPLEAPDAKVAKVGSLTRYKSRSMAGSFELLSSLPSETVRLAGELEALVKKCS